MIDLWWQYQDELDMHGVTARAKQLDWQVWLAKGMARGTRIPRLAYPDA